MNYAGEPDGIARVPSSDGKKLYLVHGTSGWSPPMIRTTIQTWADDLEQESKGDPK